MKYQPTIGIEVHAELKTKTKMFCGSANDSEETRPNVNICPVCMAHPGTLPVINKAAVKHVLRVGAAIGGTLADYTEFDRKNYFYPDLPKGYQISQYKHPLVSGGGLAGVRITRVHLEEDTARSQHSGEHSLVDFNRAGVPLMELVTEPVIHTAEEARKFAQELQLLLRYLGASDSNLEKGEMRVEANISIRPLAEKDASNIEKTHAFVRLDASHKGTENENKLGIKVEVKNLNSFRSVERAIAYEMERQAKVLEKGEKVVQETRGWDENKGKTFSQRVKEESHDYRYFPDPDLPSLKLSEIPEFSLETIKKDLPELPWEKRERYRGDFGIKDEDIESFVRDNALGVFFESVVKELRDNREKVKLASNYITSDVVGMLKKEPSLAVSETLLGKLSSQCLARVVEMISLNKVSSRGAKDIITHIVREGGDPQKVAEEKNLLQVSDERALKEIAQKVVEENPDVVKEYKAGKEKSLQYLIGQGMKATKGSANPKILQGLFKEILGE